MSFDHWDEIPPAPKYAWLPDKDITTYELAKCITILIYAPHWKQREVNAQISELPPECRRHFKVI